MTSTTTTSSVPNEPQVSPYELSRMVLEPGMAHVTSIAFANMPTSLAFLCHYCFVSQNIEQLQLDLERHRIECDDIFRGLNKNATFRAALHPVITEYCQRRQHQSPPPSPTSPSSLELQPESLPPIDE